MSAVLMLTPADHGRAMSLAEYGPVQVKEGRRYELSRGIIEVTDIPAIPHAMQVYTLRSQLFSYDLAHEGKIFIIAGASECKIPIEGFESERHPDLTIYLTPSPSAGADAWAQWIPEIVIEVVSPCSRQRDYVEKPEEYLAFGVREYWIVDASRKEVLVLQRTSGRWKEQVVRPAELYRTSQLPKFELDCAAIFAAARAAAGE